MPSVRLTGDVSEPSGAEPTSHVPVASFEALYAADPDPWDFASSDYERRRYDITVAALPRRHYQRAFEPGCSIGELTARLATRCDDVRALDAAPTAVAEARRRCRKLANVRIERGELPDDWPDGQFDLVVLSEIGYYFTPSALTGLRDRAVSTLEPGGTLVAVHWRGTSGAHLLTGDDVHECLRGADGVTGVGRYEDPNFLLDLWERA